MANLKEMARWEQSIYQIDLLDPVLGGENGITNLPLLQLANRTLYLKKQAEYTQALVTPKSITANSANAVDAAGHSHEIALASTTTAGIVQLVDNLISNANDQALTAKQGKVLKEGLDTKLNKVNLKYTRKDVSVTSEMLDLSSKSSLIAFMGDQYVGNGHFETTLYNRASENIINLPLGEFRGEVHLMVSLMGAHSWMEVVYLSLGRRFYTRFNFNESSWTNRWIESISTNRLSDSLDLDDGNTAASARAIKLLNDTKLPKTANAVSATKLATPRTLSMTGDGTWSASFDGTDDVSATLTLANTGVRAGSYNSVTVDTKGRVIAGLTQTHGLITATSATGTTNTATNNSNTFLNIVASGVGQTASVGSSTQITGTNGISVSSDTAGKLIISQTIANNLTDNSTTKPLSANMGKVLKEELTALDGRKFEQRGILGLTDLNSLTASNHAGIWHQTGNSSATSERHYPITRAGTLFVLPSAYSGQQLYFPFDEAVFYKRTTNAQGVYGNWMKIGGLANTLGSTSATDALTANQGKILKEQIDTKVGKSGDETITGVKTFSSSPKAPTPPANSNDTTVATTAFVRTAITSNATVLTGTIAHGGTLPLPAGFSEAQCKFMVSVNKDNPNRSGWDINESGSHFHYGFECWLDGRTVHVGALRGHYGHATFTPGMANYMVVGIK